MIQRPWATISPPTVLKPLLASVALLGEEGPPSAWSWLNAAQEKMTAVLGYDHMPLEPRLRVCSVAHSHRLASVSFPQITCHLSVLR
jgi:hypothetical protein